MRARSLTVLLLVLAVPALSAAAVPATLTAQVGADTAAADTTAIPIAPIRVTVLRVPLLLSETPYAVTVERPDASGPGLTLAESLGGVPGLQVDNRYNFSQGDRISVRGFGARAQFGVRGVKVLVDGIPATLPDGQTSLSHLDPRWIERAEVVRGPASSLWGNAAGGVIQLETGTPPGPGIGGSASAIVGSHGLRHVGGETEWNGDPGSTGELWSGVTVSRLLYDGFRAHASADKRFASARAGWRGRRDAVRVVAHGVAYEAQNPGSLSDSLLAADPTQAYGFNVAQGTGETARQAQIGVTWTRALSPEASNLQTAGGRRADDRRPTVLDVTAWALTRDLDNPIPPVVIDLSRWAAGVRASVRGGLVLLGRRIEWVTGVDAGGQWDDRENYENEGGDRGARVLDQAERVASVAPFAQAAVPVAGPVSARAGLRYDRFRFTVDDGLVTDGDPATDDSGTRAMDQLSPSLGLTARLGPGSVYASVASSFQTPTTTELVNRPSGGQGFNPSLEPQRTWSLEGGARARVGPARLHLTAYRATVRDALIPYEVPSSPGRSFFRNAGSAVHQGLEVDGWAALGAGLSARLGYAWVDARFDQFVTAEGDRSGNRVPGVAPHRLTGRVAWTGRRTPDGAARSAGAGRVELAGRWVAAVPVNDANTATAPSYSVLDARATSPTLSWRGASAELFGGVDNVLDTDYVTSVVVNAFGGRYYEPGPGRSAYVGMRVAF